MDSLAALQRLANGRLIDEIAQALEKTAEEVVETGKPGTVTLTLKVSLAQPDGVMVVVNEKLARKSPEKDPRGAFFYAVDGTLERDDPRQPRMEFRSVETSADEVRDVDDDELVKGA